MLATTKSIVIEINFQKTMVNPAHRIGDYTVYTTQQLGRGAFGTVYKATHNDGRQAAAKEILYNLHPRAAGAEVDKVLKLPQDHKNIIKIYDVKKSCVMEPSLFIFMEFCELGDLNSYCRVHQDLFGDINHQLDLMLQIAEGVQYLHSKDLVHRDLKPANILLTQESESKTFVKITDFGLCKYLDPDEITSRMSTNVGTPRFKAPEFWGGGGPGGKVIYHRNVDVYSIGLTFLAMIQQLPTPNGILVPKAEGSLQASEINAEIGRIMYEHKKYNQPEIVVAIPKEDEPITVREIKKVIQMATNVDPEYRLSAPDLCTALDNIMAIQSQPSSLSINGDQVYRISLIHWTINDGMMHRRIIIITRLSTLSFSPLV